MGRKRERSLSLSLCLCLCLCLSLSLSLSLSLLTVLCWGVAPVPPGRSCRAGAVLGGHTHTHTHTKACWRGLLESARALQRPRAGQPDTRRISTTQKRDEAYFILFYCILFEELC